MHKDKSGDTVFHLMAVLSGYETILRDLLNNDPKGAFIGNHFRIYPIHKAILNFQHENANLLLDIDKVATIKGPKNQMALHFAAQFGSAALVERCLSLTPRGLGLHDSEGNTPLDLAKAAHRDTDIIQRLNAA